MGEKVITDSLESLKLRRGLKIMSLNVRSLLPKIEQIECILNDEAINILSLTESWLKPSQENTLLRINNYKIYRWDRKLRKKGGGICIYLNQKIKVNAQIYENLHISNQNIEIAVLQIQQPCTKPIILVSVYRPPQGNQQEFLQSIRDKIQEIGSNKNIIILGDLNIDYRQISTKSVRDLRMLAREFNLNQHIEKPTRVTTTTATQIDYIFSNLDEVAHSGVIDIMLSDHYSTYIVIKKNKVRHEKVTFTCRQLKNLDVEELASRINDVDWDGYYNMDDVDDCWSFIYKNLLDILDDLCPEKTFNNVNRKSEWVTPAIFELMHKRDHQFNKAKAQKDPDLWDEARATRNLVNDACKQAKKGICHGKISRK